MAAAVLRSSLGLALRRAAAAALASSSSRLSSSAGGGGANTRAARTYYGYGWRSRYDAQSYTPEFFPAQRDKADAYFGFAAFVGAMLFVSLLDGDCRFWWRRDTSTRPPRMTCRRGR